MKTMAPQTPGDSSAEIAALVEVLHKTGQRLEQLTGGEVDSVTSHAGRTFLLQHAQDQLRVVEATKQAAILNALPANIALLDTQGLIVAVNEAWRRFDDANAAHSPGHEVGTNYVTICDRARGQHSAEARQAGAGIRSVLTGETRRFVLEYPSHSATQQHWFMMTVTPLSEGRPNGVVVMHADISERKRTEAEKTKFLDVLEASLNEIYVFDAHNLHFDYVNEGARRNLGYTTDEMRQQTPLNLKPEFTEDRFNKLVEPLRRHEKPKIVFKTVHRRADGSHYPVEVHLQLVERAGKGVFLAVINDITERKQAERALLTSMEEFRTLAESMPQIVWITRADGWTVYLNHQWMEYTGRTREESLGHGWLESFHPDEQRQAWDAWQQAQAAIGVYSIETRMRRADGAYRWWLIRGVPLQDSNGNILKWFGTCTDIHDLKMAELEITRANQELRESERRFSDMLQNVELLSLMLDREARITYCNDYLLRLSGWAREEVIGRSWFELFIPPANTDLKDIFSTLLANSPEAWHYENEILTRAGERRLIRWNNSVLLSGAGEVIGTASIGEDITAQKQADIKIKRLNRVYAMLSGINALTVRARDRDELFREACRIAVEAGAFKMAWIGTIDPKTLDGKVVAWCGGEESYIDKVRFTARAGTPDSERPACRATRQLQPVICNDIATESSMVQRKELVRRGHKSSGYFPLTVAGRTEAVIALFAGEADIFDDDETRLLRDLAGDISFALDHLEKQERLNYLAYYDVLTGLANRALFHERLEQGVVNADKQGRKLALVLLDIERFKTINDTLGQQGGDALLKAVAARMSEFAVDVGRLGRLDADHFAVMVLELQTGEELARLIEQRVEEVFGPPFRIGDSELRLAAKFGIAMFPEDGADANTLFRNAEAALKNAKTSGERYLFYTQAMNARIAEKLTLENQLRQALENSEFVLHYQPKINLVSGKLTSAEALIRWNDPRTGLVPPGRFIPILEETGLINEVGRWALRQAVADYLRWRAAGLAAVRIAVNVSPLQLRHRGFIAEVEQAIGVDAHAAAGLELEITESLIMEDVKHSIVSLRAIRALGVTIAIDDFGTGFSSLSYLSKLPVDTLKIDRSFVLDMTAGPEGLALVSTIINLAHSLKLKVVAEGVETEEQSRLLRLVNCDEMQGYLFSKAVPSEIFEAKFLARSAEQQ